MIFIGEINKLWLSPSRQHGRRAKLRVLTSTFFIFLTVSSLLQLREEVWIWQRQAFARSFWSSTRTQEVLSPDVTKIGYYDMVRDRHNETTLQFRSQRFPSVEERVKIYMTNWYLPPCTKDDGVEYLFKLPLSSPSYTYSNYGEVRVRALVVPRGKDSGAKPTSLVINQTFSIDYLSVFDRQSIIDCATKNTTAWNMRSYCLDAQDTIVRAMDRTNWHYSNELYDATSKKTHDIPLLMQFGDAPFAAKVGYVSLPHIKKFRAAMTQNQVQRVTSSGKSPCYRTSPPVPHSVRPPDYLQPILWKLNTGRHYHNLEKVHKIDTPWQDKIPRAVFRGAATGLGIHKKTSVPPSTKEVCLRTPRCRLVFKYANSSLVDAKLTGKLREFPETLDGVALNGNYLSMEEMLKYKVVISLEGNDVSSGLKWFLYSDSVVIMPAPTFTSWAMEERLEAWVHYIPCRPDLTDVEEKVQWALDHDAEAFQIARRGKLWIWDLLYHPDSASDERRIEEEILTRYRSHFTRPL